VRRVVLLLPLTLLAFGSAEAQGPAPTPGASATAWAIRITPAGGTPAGTPAVSAPPNATPALGSVFSYPADGSILTAQSTTASAVTKIERNAAALADSVTTSISIFGGEITADAVTAKASAGTGPSGAGGNVNGSAVANLKVSGQPVTGTRIPLADWGTLTIGAQGIDRTAPAGTKGYRGFVAELDIHLNVDHGGLPANSEIQIGYAETAVQTAPPAAPAATTTAAARSDVSYHHGDDIFGQLGQPLLAVADGTIFSVGWNKIGGNRLWLLDEQGNQFYYAHLSAFSTAATNGARVKAGQVVGFMGNTGDAEGTPVHLHFEVHPVSLLYLGYDGAVDPTPYLDAWSHQQDLPFPIAAGWVPGVPGGASAPEPGAILLGMSDISTADGLDPASLERALTPLKPSALMQTIVPTVSAPTTDLGRG
jgi:murein DD-endopeptidase MepM/ murein hydrolase activator NlpD